MLVIKGQRRTESKKVLKTTSWSALVMQGFQRKKTFAKKYSESLNNESLKEFIKCRILPFLILNVADIYFFN